MDFLVSYLVPFLIMITPIVFIHEMGHFLVARYYGVRVEVFSIGFGPELFGWTDRYLTRWRFSLIPLGGYVRMFGDADASSRPDADKVSAMTEEERALTLPGKPVLQRMAISAAGPFANFLFAIPVLAILFMAEGESFYPAKVGEILPHSPAAHAGLQEGDRILSVNGENVQTFEEVIRLVRQNKEGEVIELALQRMQEGSPTPQEWKVRIKPKRVEEEKPFQLGIKAPELEQIYHSPLKAIGRAFSKTREVCQGILQGIGQMIVGSRSSKELGGILSIGEVASHSLKGGYFFLFMALISINLGLINLIPIPGLDGGHLLFYAIEGIKGKPLPIKLQESIFLIGVCLIALIMLLSTWNDLQRFEVVGFFRNLIGF